MSVDEQKRAAGEAAALIVESGMTVGLGTGSTAVFFVEALAIRARKEGLSLICVATSEATATLASARGLRLVDLDDAGEIDLTVDGADEFEPGLIAIKGGGGALLREKLVWEGSRRRVIIADAGKRVETLGAFPLPVEVATFGHRSTRGRIEAVLELLAMSASCSLRMREGRPFLTDNGNLIYDFSCGTIPMPDLLAAELKRLTGVVEQGLFVATGGMGALADEALVGTDEGVVRVVAPPWPGDIVQVTAYVNDPGAPPANGN